MKYLIAVLSVSLFTIAGCNKNSEPGNVYVRIENGTGIVLEQAMVEDGIYGNIGLNSVSNYQVVTAPLYGGFCSFLIKGERLDVFMPICGTPPPAKMGPGHYTFRVEAPIPDHYIVIVKTD